MTNKELGWRRKYLRDENRKWPKRLIPVPPDNWPKNHDSQNRTEVWRSSTLLVQIFAEADGARRLSIARCELDSTGGWKDGLSWEELMQVKREASYGEWWAVEIFPADAAVVNVANMRHLWILPQPPAFAWRSA